MNHQNSSSLTPRQQNIKQVYEMLYPYQKDVFKRMVQDRRHLNYMEPGMGKSIVTGLAIEYLEAFPCIIVCPKNAMRVWEKELAERFDEPAVIYAGKPKQREAAWKEFAVGGYNFIITNQKLVQELGVRFGIDTSTKPKGSSDRGTAKAKPTPQPGTHKWKVGGLIADEIQLMGLFNHKNQTYEVFKKLCRHIPNIYLLTGTPYRRGVIDFYAPLSLVNMEEFKSPYPYEAKWCTVIQSGFGRTVERDPKDPIAFRAMLREYASILKSADHLKDLPGKIRQPWPIEMDDEQGRIYRELSEELYTLTDSDELIMSPSVLALSVRQRQLLACPQELGLATKGAAIETMLELSEDLVDQKKPFVVFTPFKQAIKWIRQALNEKYPGIQLFELMGGLTEKQFGDTWQGFQEYKGNQPRAMLCVIRSGAAFHATCASTCFFIGYEWDFNQNEQAENRLNRIGQKDLVKCYYLMYRHSIDEDVAQRLNEKKASGNLVLASEEEFQQLWAKRLGEGG